MGAKRGAALGAAYRLLFQPRAWVVNLARCVMREHGLQPRRYFSVHVRQSAEKAAEIRKLRQGFRMPRLVLYYDLTTAVATRLQQRTLFLKDDLSKRELGVCSRAARPAPGPIAAECTWGCRGCRLVWRRAALGAAAQCCKAVALDEQADGIAPRARQLFGVGAQPRACAQLHGQPAL